MRGTWGRLLVVVLAVAVAAAPARAFDHLDGPAVQADHATDITDLFAWMSPDATHLNLVMTVFPLATDFSKFSNSAAYVFHTASRSTYMSGTSTPVDVICTFQLGAPQSTQCWVGSQAYVAGDASDPAGLASADGRVRVFAGPRDDPAFVNVDGLSNFKQALFGAGLSLDVAGCPAVNPSASAALVALLQHGVSNGAPTNRFQGANVLALVVSLDLSLVTSGGPIVSVWGSTNRQ